MKNLAIFKQSDKHKIRHTWLAGRHCCFTKDYNEMGWECKAVPCRYGLEGDYYKMRLESMGETW